MESTLTFWKKIKSSQSASKSFGNSLSTPHLGVFDGRNNLEKVVQNVEFYETIAYSPVWRVRQVHAEVFFRPSAMRAEKKPLHAELDWVSRSERPVHAKK